MLEKNTHNFYFTPKDINSAIEFFVCSITGMDIRDSCMKGMTRKELGIET